MPKLEDAQSLGALPSASTGRGIARYDTSGIGNAVAGFGAQVAQSGMDLQAKWQAADDVAMQGKWQEFQYNEDKLYDESTRNMEPGQAQGFAERYKAGYQERAKGFLSAVPDRLKPGYDQALYEREHNTWGSSLTFERGEQRRFALTSMGDTVSNALLPRVEMAAQLPEGDPNKKRVLDEVQADGLKMIDGNPALSPVEKDEARRKLRTAVQSAFAGALPASERMNIDPSAGYQTVGERIIQIESGGNPNAANPDSTAVGAGQFTEGTWLRQIQKSRPDLAQGKSRSEILQLRTDPALSKQMVEALAADNSSYLTARGQEANPGNIYLAHFLGADGAVAMLGADREVSAANINPSAASANQTVFYNPGEDGKPDLNNPRSVGEVIGWAQSRMDGTEHVNWSEALDALPYETKVTMGSDASAEMVRMQTAQKEQQQQAYNQGFNDLLNGIADGRAGMSDIGAAYDNGSGWLTDYDDRMKAVKAVEERDRDGLSMAATADRLARGDQFNPFADEDKKAIDQLYDKGMAQGGAGLLDHNPSVPPDERTGFNPISLLSAIIDRTGYIPTSAKDRLNMGMWSPDGQTRDQAFLVADGLYRQNPNAFSRAFGEAGLKRLQEYQAVAALPEDTRSQRLDPNASPEQRKLFEEMEKEGREVVKDKKPGDIVGEFGDGWWPGGETAAPLDGMASREMMGDYKQFYADRFASLNGDPQAAHVAAMALLKQKWGSSEIGSGAYIMAYPPEQFFPTVDGGHDWLDEQIDTFVSKEFPGAQEWSPVALPATKGAVGSGATPLWGVTVIDKDGVFRTLLPPKGARPGWPFDYNAERQKRLAEFEADRATDVGAQQGVETQIPPGRDFTEGANPSPLLGGQ